MNLATRSTEVAIVSQCPGRYALQTLCEAEQASASFFDLGTAAHAVIDRSVGERLSLDQALAALYSLLDSCIERAAGAIQIIESSRRTYAGIKDDAERIVTKWFDQVHPDSPTRLPIYDEYQWPPRTELRWSRDVGTAHPIWGTADALFESKTPGAPPLLVDWKSGTKRQRSSFQLHFYMFGMGVTDARAVFHNLDKPRQPIQETDPYPGDAAVRQRILATEAIKASMVEGRYPMFLKSPLCRFCPVQGSCPAFGSHRERADKAASLRRFLRLVAA